MNRVLKVKNINETKMLAIPNNKKIVKLLGILIFFSENDGTLLINNKATKTVK
jgi:hypothetical protein